MSLKQAPSVRVLGLTQPFVTIFPDPIRQNRDPLSSDVGELGQIFINYDTAGWWICSQTPAQTGDGTFNWVAAAAGSVTATDMTVDPGDVTITAGDLIVTAGDATIGGTLSVTGEATFANVTVNGVFTFTGDFDLTSAQLIDLTSNLDAAPSIYLHADGGTSEQILLRSDQGTAADSISLLSDVGGITLTSTGLATADAINLVATLGGIDMDAALQINIASSRNTADAIVLSASAGGIDILAAGAAAEDIDIVNTAGSVNISGGEDIASAVVISAGAGGIDILATGEAAQDIDIVNTGGSVNVRATEDAALAVFIEADGGTSETIYIHSDQGTGAASIQLESDVGGITLTSGLASADAINLVSSAGGLDVDAALQINIASSEAAADAVRIIASDAGGGIDIDCGTGSFDVLTTGSFSIDGADDSNVSVTGAGKNLVVESVGGSVLVSSTEDAASAIRIHTNGGVSETILLENLQGTGVDAIELVATVGGLTLTSNLATTDGINLNAIGGGIDVNAALEINIASSEAAVADAIRIVASAADGGIDVDAGTGGITIDSTGAISIDAAAASNVTVTGAGLDLTLASVGGSVAVTSTENAASAISLIANGGTSETVKIQATQGTGISAVDVLSAGGVRVTSGALAATTGLNLVQGAVNASIQVGAGDPGHAAPKGTLYIKTDATTTTTRLWINTDASTAWTYFTSNA